MSDTDSELELEAFLSLKEVEDTSPVKLWHIISSLLLMVFFVLLTRYSHVSAIKFILEEHNGRILVNNGKGPTIYAKTNESIRVSVVNKLDVKTSIHFHGLTLPASMDGLRAIEPGSSFEYTFKVVDDPGTYWWHAHDIARTKGLYGAFIIGDGGQIVMLGDLSHRGEHAHASNLTINGVVHSPRTELMVEPGLLRLINVAASADVDIFFDESTHVVAVDGRDIDILHVKSLSVSPGQRYDVVTSDSRIDIEVRDHMNVTQTDFHPTQLPTTRFSLEQLDFSVATISNNTLQVDHRNNLMLIVNEDHHAHPIHIHGHKFHVLAADDYFYDIKTGAQHSKPFEPSMIPSLHQSVLRDTVTVNGHGWALIHVDLRPGKWLMHCHDVWHLLDGLSTFLQLYLFA